MEHLNKKDIEEIIFLNKQGGGRIRLITNLYKIDRATLHKIVQTHNTSNKRYK